MNKEFARTLTCLMDEKLKLPSMVLESIEENLVKGDFDKVHKYYCERLKEIEENKSSGVDIKKTIFIKNYKMCGRVTRDKYLKNEFNKKTCDEYCTKEQIQALLDGSADWIFFWTPE